MQRQRVVANGAFFRRPDVLLGARPPHAVHLIARVVDRRRFLDRGRVHHTPAPQEDVVRTLLADLQPSRLLLDARMGHRDRRQLVAVHFRAFLQQRDRLATIRAVMVDQRDLLALELVEATELLGQMLDQDVGRRPIGAEQREVPREHAAVRGLRPAIAHADDRNLVARRLLGEREGDAGGERRDHRRAGRALALETLVAFDPAVGGVAGLALLDHELDAIGPAIALVDQREIVAKSVGERNAVWRIRTGPIDQRWNELLIGLRACRRRRPQDERRRHRSAQETYPLFYDVHESPPLTGTRDN